MSDNIRNDKKSQIDYSQWYLEKADVLLKNYKSQKTETMKARILVKLYEILGKLSFQEKMCKKIIWKKEQ